MSDEETIRRLKELEARMKQQNAQEDEAMKVTDAPDGPAIGSGWNHDRSEHVLTADVMGVQPGDTDLWCNRVKFLIETASRDAAGYELMQLVNYALKTQHSDYFNRQVRDCVLMFSEECKRGLKQYAPGR